MATTKRGSVPEYKTFDGKRYKLYLILGTKKGGKRMATELRTPFTLIRLVKYPSSYITPLGLEPKYNCGRACEMDSSRTFYCLYGRNKSYKTYEEEDRARLLHRRRQNP